MNQSAFSTQEKTPVHLHVFPKDISGDVNKVAPFSLMSDIDAIGCLYHISCQLSFP